MSIIYGKPVNVGGGSKIPQNLPPLNPNFRLEFSGTTVTITANKLPKNDNTAMLAGGVWVLDSKMPESPKGAIVKQWTAAELIDATQTEESKETVTWTYTNWTKGEPVYCRQYTYNPKGQYNTTVMGGVASTLDKPPFELPVFTGNHSIFGDETAGRIELYESGTLTLSPGTYDFFLVGGGGGGSSAPVETGSGAGGGGGGYTKTQFSYKLAKTRVINVGVGAGGTGGRSGTASTIDLAPPEVILSASGGTTIAVSHGGNAGGSGGGAGGFVASASGSSHEHGGAGGSDGANGQATQTSSRYPGGIGQGANTRAFGVPGGVIYSGGGGGGGARHDSSNNQDTVNPGVGGSGGGGSGGGFKNQSSISRIQATPGTPNTGGGGGGGSYNTYGSDYNVSPAAGGSGIVIVRWNNTL